MKKVKVVLIDVLDFSSPLPTYFILDYFVHVVRHFERETDKRLLSHLQISGRCFISLWSYQFFFENGKRLKCQFKFIFNSILYHFTAPDRPTAVVGLPHATFGAKRRNQKPRRSHQTGKVSKTFIFFSYQILTICNFSFVTQFDGKVQ